MLKLGMAKSSLLVSSFLSEKNKFGDYLDLGIDDKKLKIRVAGIYCRL